MSIHGLADPAAGMAPGESTNTELQALYDELAASGIQSLEPSDAATRQDKKRGPRMRGPPREWGYRIT